MNNYKSVELYDESHIIHKMGDSIKMSEMSAYERRFLCGLLAEKKPKHVLEIGVAEGATTSVICYCLSEIGLYSKVISIDLCSELWNDKTKETGYIAQFECNKKEWTVDWKLYKGELVTEYLSNCSKTIDFVILDTMHSLPGEILDFLAVAPYLQDGAVIVLHDIGLNHLYSFEKGEIDSFSGAFATKLLFDVVTADKYYNPDESRIGKLSNIGAFEFTDKTMNDILDVLSCLTITWHYLPDYSIIQIYRSLYCQFYNNEFQEMFEGILYVQSKTVSEKRITEHYRGDITTLCKRWSSADNVYIYGCGIYGFYYYQFAMHRNLPVTAIVVSDGETVDCTVYDKFKLPIYYYSDIEKSGDNDWIVLALKRDYDACLRYLTEMGWKNIL